MRLFDASARRPDPHIVAAGDVACLRAAHQFLDNPRVFDDPLALAILGREDEAALRASVGRIDTPTFRRRCLFTAARSRYAEDQLAAAVGCGARQYVILGAGLDTYAFRPHAAADLRVFEVDHPVTQAWKRTRLAEAAMTVPESLRFVPVDFDHQSLSEALDSARFRTDSPAFFSWLDAVMYQDLRAVRATLRFVAALPPASSVVFDYVLVPSALDPARRAIYDSLEQRVARHHDRRQLFFEPAQLAALLRELGFHRLEDLGPEELNARYFHGRAEGLCLSGGQSNLITAWV